MNQPEPWEDHVDLVDVREAARLAGRSAETIRRWIWGGRLPTQRQGNRHVMRKEDVIALSAKADQPVTTLAAWASLVHSAAEEAPPEPGESSADLILEDRRLRSAGDGP